MYHQINLKHNLTRFLLCLEQCRPAAEWYILVLSLQTVLQGPGPIHQVLSGVEEGLGAAEDLLAAEVSTYDRIAQRCCLQLFKFGDQSV